MGLPIWRSPPPSPRPSAAALHCDATTHQRTVIRRRISPRVSPRDSTHRFAPFSRPVRSTTYHGSRQNSSSLETRTVAAGISNLTARLNDLSSDAVWLREWYRQRVEGWAADAGSRYLAARQEATQRLRVDRRHRREDSEIGSGTRILNEEYEHAVLRFQNALYQAASELRRLESRGVQLLEQRRHLLRLHSDFFSRHMPQSDEESIVPTLLNIPLRSETSIERVDSEPAPQILSVPERFTSSPQPLQENMSSGAVRSSSVTSPGPDMEISSLGELPPLRRMGDRTINGQAPISGSSAPLPSDEDALTPRYPLPLHYHSRPPYPPSAQRFHPLLSPSDLPTPLRSLDHAQPARSLHINGLGDRTLSPSSPSATSQTSDQDWTTMESTIAPDTRLPSASSSFASDAASRSFTSSSGNSSRAASSFSARTAITVPEDACDTVDEVWGLIAERLHRGEDVPDDMWLSAGVPAAHALMLARATRERV